VFDDGAKSQVALFGEDIRRADDTEAVGVRLGEVQLKHLWQWDAWWVSCVRWLKYQLKRAAPGLTPRTALEKFNIMQMVDVHLPTTDGRHLILSRYTQPEPEHHPLLDQLRLKLPAQPPPKITARASPISSTQVCARIANSESWANARPS
jgi:hypothetical protein